MTTNPKRAIIFYDTPDRATRARLNDLRVWTELSLSDLIRQAIRHEHAAHARRRQPKKQQAD